MSNYDVTIRNLLEEEILASIMFFSEGNKISDMKDLITVKHGFDDVKYFYSSIHQSIFGSILRCWENNVPASFLMVLKFRPDEYKDRENPDSHKGFDAVVTNIYIKYVGWTSFHQKAFLFKQYILQDYWNEKSYDILQNGWDYRDVLTVSDNIKEGYDLLFDKLTKHFKESNSIKDVKERAREEYEKVQSGIVNWVPTGIIPFDDRRKGWRNGEFTIIAARPSMGKSALMVGSAKNSSFKYKKKGCLFSLEVSKQQIMNHIIASETGFNYEDIKDYKLSKENFEIVLQWYDYFEKESLLRIYDITDARTAQEIYDKVQADQPEFAIIDYLQLTKLDKKISTKSFNREQEVSEISRSFKLMATEFNIPVIAGAQLSRKVDDRPTKRPQLSDLRESGSIEQDADNVLFPFRQAYYDEINNPTVTIPFWQKGNFDMHQAKGRDSGTGHFLFNLDLVTYKFRDGLLEGPPPLEYSFPGMTQ